MVKVAHLLVFLLILSVSYATGCEDCKQNDCSTDSSPDVCTIKDGGCTQMSASANFGNCESSFAIFCNSANLEKLSNTLENGFLFDPDNKGGKPYYCTNYNLTPDTYAWKTCYSGAPDNLWTSTHLACKEGTLLNCSVNAPSNKADVCARVGNFYCDGSQWVEDTDNTYPGILLNGAQYCDTSETLHTCDSSHECDFIDGLYCNGMDWVSVTEAKDVCQDACTSSNGLWFKGEITAKNGEGNCCESNDDFFNSTTACDMLTDDGVAKTVAPSYLWGSCGDSVNMGSPATTYYYGPDGWTITQYYSISSIWNGQTDTACCTESDACSAGGVCYSNDATHENYICDGGTWRLANGQLCTQDEGCYSGYCKTEYGGTNRYCAPMDKCVANGGTITTDAFCDGSTSITCTDQGDGVYDWSQTNCNEPSDSDGGDAPLEAGAVSGVGTCSNGACTSPSTQKDSCSGNTLTEYYLSNGAVSSKDHDCSTYSGLTKISSDYLYNESSCTTNSEEEGYCKITQVDPDNNLAYCVSPLSVIGEACCGDDSGESFAVEGSPSICYNGEKITCSTTCDEYIISSKNYYCDGTNWVLSAGAQDKCESACTDQDGTWKEGTLESGSKCCLSENKASIVHVTTTSENVDYLCDGANWISASTEGEIVADFYLSDGTNWNNCTTPGTEKLIGSDTYICTENGWQNKECSEQGDEYQSVCESCGGVWLGNKCCGDDSEDYFKINETYFCQGTSGLSICDTTCKTAKEGDTLYYCFNNVWETNPAFTGEFPSPFEDSTGCCLKNQCWSGTACKDEGELSGQKVCDEGIWKVCNETNLCKQVQAGGSTYYCTDEGWKTIASKTCAGSSGVCVNQECKKCGVDFEIGETVNNLTCLSSGSFGNGCSTDVDCPSSKCTVGKCVAGTCQEEPTACGTPCDGGVCDGLGTCSGYFVEGNVCQCNEICGEHLFCDNGVCKQAEFCGDGKCDKGECSACQQDCSLQQCIGDGACTTSLGETCENSKDCECTGTKYCNPENELADSWGCVTPECGNGICEKGECSYCKKDCSLSDCNGNGKCDTVIGETCENSKDCVCKIEVKTEEIPLLKLGESDLLRVYLENTGNSPMKVNLELNSNGAEIKGGEQLVYLEPNSKKDVILQITPTKSGTQQIEVLAKADGQVNKLGEFNINVKSGNLFDTAYSLFKASPFYKYYDVIGIAGLLFSAITFVFKRLTPKTTVPYYAGQTYQGQLYNPTYSYYQQQMRRY